MASYERLKAWQLAYRLALAIYELTDGFPRDERFGLTSQLRRAAFSVPANIAEGAAKRGRKEFRRYLDIALGSVTEIEVALRIVRDRQYITRAMDRDRTVAKSLWHHSVEIVQGHE